ncbi:ornithine decarboxylase-like [Pollicipes pollicipes]|uniref:ornithine decarboxylase-like n=1 Tax=Pollicipes pollicipes TaxID=41117 RepID=UPI0018854754|nr:ornithine decarboxylase-like [Pollicipes pollicipes]
MCDVVGVSFTVGPACREFAVYDRAHPRGGGRLRPGGRLGLARLTLLDLGGGFAGDAARPRPLHGASAFTLATQVTSVRRRSDAVDYYVNDGVYGAFNCVLYDHQVCRPRPLQDDAPPSGPPATIWGPTCDSMDQLCEGQLLPPLQPGHWLVWDNMGAYTLSAAGTFNGFPRASVCCVITAPLSEAVRAAVGPLSPMPEPAIQPTQLPAEQCVAEN